MEGSEIVTKSRAIVTENEWIAYSLDSRPKREVF